MTTSNETRSILMVRSGALGDTILTIPVLEAIRQSRPEARITLLGNRAYRSLIPPEFAFQPIDSVEWAWLFEPCLDPGIEKRVPFDEAYVVLANPEPVVESLRNSGVNRITSTSSRAEPRRHLVETVCARMGLPTPPRKARLKSIDIGPRTDMMWLHPGSGGPRKCVPIPVLIEYAEAAKQAVAARHIAVTLGEADEFVTEDPHWSRLVAREEVTVVHGRTLEDLRRKLGSSCLFMGNDSGIGHLAANLGIPSIVVFRSTDPAVWQPWVPDESLCVVDERADEVSDAIQQIESFAGRYVETVTGSGI